MRKEKNGTRTTGREKREAAAEKAAPKPAPKKDDK